MKTRKRRLRIIGVLSLGMFLNIFVFSSADQFSHAQTGVETVDIETNFNILKLSKIKIYTDSEDKSFVISSCGLDKSTIFLANRKSDYIDFYSNKDRSVSKAGTIPTVNKLANLQTGKQNYILDLLCDKGGIYVSYVESFGELLKCDRVYVSRGKINKSNHITFEEKPIFRSEPCVFWKEPSWNGLAGRIALSDSKLYISGGLMISNVYENSYPNSTMDGLLPDFAKQEKLTNFFGAIASVDLKSGVSNKFANGFRAPQGLFYDKRTKTLWETEHGPRGGDELNVVEYSKNYGWPYVTLGYAYEEKYMDSNFPNSLHAKYGTHAGYSPPTFSWTPSVAPSQLVRLPESTVLSKWWGGDLVVSTLKDKSLIRLKISKTNQVLYEERINIGNRIRDLDIFSQGLVMSTDEGYMLFLSPTELRPEKAFPSI
jgi:hypothetical protein